jgi:hypothetical protein
MSGGRNLDPRSAVVVAVLFWTAVAALDRPLLARQFSLVFSAMIAVSAAQRAIDLHLSRGFDRAGGGQHGARAIWLRYRRTICGPTAFWIAAALVMFVSVWALKTGPGGQWLTDERAIVIREGGPISNYSTFDAFLFVSAFFVISGLVRLPMYYFFEWLAARKRVAALFEVRT